MLIVSFWTSKLYIFYNQGKNEDPILPKNFYASIIQIINGIKLEGCEEQEDELR